MRIGHGHGNNKNKGRRAWGPCGVKLSPFVKRYKETVESLGAVAIRKTLRKSVRMRLGMSVDRSSCAEKGVRTKNTANEKELGWWH